MQNSWRALNRTKQNRSGSNEYLCKSIAIPCRHSAAPAVVLAPPRSAPQGHTVTCRHAAKMAQMKHRILTEAKHKIVNLDGLQFGLEHLAMLCHFLAQVFLFHSVPLDRRSGEECRRLPCRLNHPTGSSPGECTIPRKL